MPANPTTAKRIVLFNHKGGVGKTTLTVNLAYALVNAGKRVLLVDTDPQCSMSSFFLEEKFLDHGIEKTLRAYGAANLVGNPVHAAISDDEICACCRGGRLLPVACRLPT